MMSMDELPQDILFDILSRVSIESLLQYRCVCKRWREVIDDSYFRNSTHRVKEHALLYLAFSEEKIYLLKTQEKAPAKKILLSKLPGLKGYMLQGACNGLLFFMHHNDVKNYPEFLFNPLTKEIVRLPRAPDLRPDTSVYGLGFDCSTNTYKMVQIDKIGFDEKTHACTMMARVYDFKKRLWRNCKAQPPFHYEHPDSKSFFLYRLLSSEPMRNFVFASGALNWYFKEYSSGNIREILTFDLAKEELSLISIPDVCLGCPRWALMGMHDQGGSLALAHHPKRTHLDVWVLKDYTRREWTRKYRIQLPRAKDIHIMWGPHKSDELILVRWTKRDTDLLTYHVNEDRFTRCPIGDDVQRLSCETLSLASVEQHGEEEVSASVKL